MKKQPQAKPFNRIESVNCEACGKAFLVSEKSKVLRDEKNYINTPCTNCGHVQRVNK